MPPPWTAPPLPPAPPATFLDPEAPAKPPLPPTPADNLLFEVEPVLNVKLRVLAMLLLKNTPPPSTLPPLPPAPPCQLNGSFREEVPPVPPMPSRPTPASNELLRAVRL